MANANEQCGFVLHVLTILLGIYYIYYTVDKEWRQEYNPIPYYTAWAVVVFFAVPVAYAMLNARTAEGKRGMVFVD